MSIFDPTRPNQLNPFRQKSGHDLGGYQEGETGKQLETGLNSQQGFRDSANHGHQMRERENRFAASLKAQLSHGKHPKPDRDGPDNEFHLLARIMPRKDNEHDKAAKPSTMELPMQLSFMNPEGDGVLLTVKVNVEPKALAQELAGRVRHVAKIVGDQINANLRTNIEGTGKDGVRFDIQVQDKGIALNGISVHSQGNVITVTMRTVEGALDPETLNSLAASLAASLSMRFPKKVIEIAGRIDTTAKDGKHPERGGGDEIAAILGNR
jgi:hypothetical protein